MKLTEIIDKSKARIFRFRHFSSAFVDNTYCSELACVITVNNAPHEKTKGFAADMCTFPITLSLLVLIFSLDVVNLRVFDDFDDLSSLGFMNDQGLELAFCDSLIINQSRFFHRSIKNSIIQKNLSRWLVCYEIQVGMFASDLTLVFFVILVCVRWG